MPETAQLSIRQTCQFRRHEFLARANEARDSIYRLEEGWACQYRLLTDGRRQIITLFLPGDYCEPQWLLQGRASLPITALTRIRARKIPHTRIQSRAAREDDSTVRILGAMVEILRNREKWIFNLGRMTACERICNLLCEIYDRLNASNRVIQGRCAMPLTQYDLADFTGISAVHVNRVLQSLRAQRLVDLSGRCMEIPDLAALRKLGGSRLEAVR